MSTDVPSTDVPSTDGPNTDAPRTARPTVPAAGTLITIAPTGAETAKADCPQLPTTLALTVVERLGVRW